MTTDAHLLLAAYALDALEPQDRSTFEAHLATCLPCRRDLAAVRPSVQRLDDLDVP